MSTIESPVSDMLVTVKSREIQRGMLAEMAGEAEDAARHFLAAAHLELVLAQDYAMAGLDDLALRSRVSAASCFGRAGEMSRSHSQFEAILKDYPQRAEETRRVMADLEGNRTAVPKNGDDANGG